MDMQIPAGKDPELIMRRAGYGKYFDSKTGKWSFMKRLRTDMFPRFHVYIETKKIGACISLHLDQKRPSYAGTSAHGGEYDGPVVEREIARIALLLESQ